MTSFDVDANFHAVADPAMLNGRQRINYDLSTLDEQIIEYVPNQGASVVGGVGPACYNGNNQYKFTIFPDLGSRTRLDKSYIKFDYVAYDVSVPAPYGPIDPTQVSIPWNPVAFIQSVMYQLNSCSQSIEVNDAIFQHGNMIKILTSYTKPALDEAHDHFFTPCVEEARDVTTQMSVASYTRAARHLVVSPPAPALPYPQQGSKTVMLSDIFDSLKPELALNLNLIQLLITLKSPTEILFHTTAAIGINNFYVTGMKLYIVYNTITQEQKKEDMPIIDRALPMVRASYNRYEVTSDIHATGKTYHYSGVKNMQAAVLMFPSTTCGDGVGINPYQYCYASGPVLNTGITFYRHRYGKYFYPPNGQIVDAVNKSKNSDLYAHWRSISRLINDKIYASPVPFFPSMSVQGPAFDVCPYVFFPAIFTNQDTAFRKNMQPYEHDIATSGGFNGGIGVVVRIRMNAFCILGNLNVTLQD